MGDCEKIWKKLVMFFNIVFLVFGLGILGYGIYLQLTLEGFSAITGYDYINPGTLLIIIGGIMVILAFFGCCGAWFGDNSCGTCMLRTFAALIAFLLLLQIILGLVVYFKQDSIKDHLKESMQKYNTNNATENDQISKIWDTMQQYYKCCGVEHPSDWDDVLGKSVPDSCCKEETPDCGKDVRKTDPDPKAIFGKGCYLKLSENSVLWGSVGGVLLVIQLLAIIIPCCMARRRGYQRGNDSE